MNEIKRITGFMASVLKSLKGWLSRNIWLKVISLVLGLFLWFHAVTDQTHQIDYPVPLKVTLADSSLVIVNDPPSQVNILFAGTGKELLYLWLKHPHFDKVVEDDAPGVKNVNLDVSSLSMPTDLSLIPLGVKSPTEVHLVVDRVIEKEVRVASRLKVRPKEEYVIVGGVSIKPPTVELKGARGELSGLDSIRTVEGFLGGVTDSFTTMLPLDFTGLKTVTSSVSEVTLSGRVEKYVEFELDGIPITLKGRLKDKFRLSPERIQVVVVGPVSLIQGLKNDEIDVYIEINDPPVGETYYSPMIELPDGIELLSEQPKLFRAVPINETPGKPSANLTQVANPPG